MPTLSFFYGIKIQMYWDDHPPPHFHAEAGDGLLVVELGTWRIRRGVLPPDKMKLVLQWARQHEAELQEARELCRLQKPPIRIAPLP